RPRAIRGTPAHGGTARGARRLSGGVPRGSSRGHPARQRFGGVGGDDVDALLDREPGTRASRVPARPPPVGSRGLRRARTFAGSGGSPMAGSADPDLATSSRWLPSESTD